MSNDFLLDENSVLFENAINEYNKMIEKNNISDTENCNVIDKKKDHQYSNENNDLNYVEDVDYVECINNLEDLEFHENATDSSEELEEKKDELKDVCKHINIISENGVTLCESCGKEVERTIYQEKEWRYYGQADSKRTIDPTRVHARKIDDRSIFKDVENMGFSDKITSLANKIYTEVTKGDILRGNSRKSVIFSCIFHAYKIMDKPQSHEKLIKIFELTKKASLKGLKYVNLNAPKDSLIHTTYITPINLVEDIMDMFNSTMEQKQEVYNIYEKIKNKSSKINRSRPQSIASGLVYFWISYKNIDITLKDFAKKVSLSELTIIRLAREISEILGIIPESWI